MSLPSYAKFIKDDKTVGVGFCNIGWVVDPRNIWRCCKDAMENAMNYYDKADMKFEYVRDKEFHDKQRASISKHFTTKLDLQNFDYLIVYDYKISRDLISKKYLNKITDEEFVDLLKQCLMVRENGKQ